MRDANRMTLQKEKIERKTKTDKLTKGKKNSRTTYPKRQDKKNTSDTKMQS